MKQRSEVCQKLKRVLAKMETAGHKVKCIISDNGGEFDNHEVRKILNDNDTEIYNAVYTSTEQL